MRIGVISEGHADRAVIENIIIGITGMDQSDIIPLRPSYKLDETDKSNAKETFSTWSVVKEECESRELIDSFMAVEGNEFVAIHIDTAESYNFLTLPDDGENYSIELRDLVYQKINEWLKDNLSDKILYAIAVEEIEAWILSIHEKGDSSKFRDAKKRMDRVLGKKELDTTSSYDNFLFLTKDFRKQRLVSKGKFLSYNSSLSSFFNEIQTKVIPRLPK